MERYRVITSFLLTSVLATSMAVPSVCDGESTKQATQHTTTKSMVRVHIEGRWRGIRREVGSETTTTTTTTMPTTTMGHMKRKKSMVMEGRWWWMTSTLG